LRVDIKCNAHHDRRYGQGRLAFSSLLERPVVQIVAGASFGAAQRAQECRFPMPEFTKTFFPTASSFSLRDARCSLCHGRDLGQDGSRQEREEENGSRTSSSTCLQRDQESECGTDLLAKPTPSAVIWTLLRQGVHEFFRQSPGRAPASGLRYRFRLGHQPLFQRRTSARNRRLSRKRSRCRGQRTTCA